MRARVVFVIVAAVVFGAGPAGRAAALPAVAPVLLAAQACNCDAEAARLQEARDRLGELQERLRDLEDRRRASAAAQEAASKSLADLQAQWNKQLGGGAGSGTGTFASSGDVEVRYNAQGQIQTYRNGQPVPGSERRSPFMSGLKARMDAAESALKTLQDEQAQIDRQIQQAQQDIARAEQDVAARQKELEDCIRRCAAASQAKPESQPPSAVQLADTAAVSNRISGELRPNRPTATFRSDHWFEYFFTRAITNALGGRAPSPLDDPSAGLIQTADPAEALGGSIPPVRPTFEFRSGHWFEYFFTRAITNALGGRAPSPLDDPFAWPRVTAASSTPYQARYRWADTIDAGTSPATTTPGGPIVRDRLWFFSTGGAAGASTTPETTNVEDRLEGKLTLSPFSGYLDSSDPYDRSSDEYTGGSWFFPSGLGSYEIKFGAGEFTSVPQVPEYKAGPSNFFNTSSLRYQLKFGADYSTYGLGPTNAPEPAENWTTFNGPHEWDDVVPRLGLTYSLVPEQVLTSGISAEYGRFVGGVVDTITRSGGNTAPLRTSYSRFADQLGSGVGYPYATIGMGAYLYSSTDLQNALRDDSFWEELRNGQYLDSISVPGGTTRISSETTTPYTDEYISETLSNWLSNRAKRRDYSWSDFYTADDTADDTPPETTTPPPGSNPTDYLQNQFKPYDSDYSLNTFYDVGSGKPAPLHFSDLPTDDAYQLIIIVYVNTGAPQRQAGMPDSLRNLIEPPWYGRLFGSIAGLLKRPGASGAAASLAYDGTAARGMRPTASRVGTRAREQRGAPSGMQPPISLVATGASSGEVFQMLVGDPASHVVAPDGLVVQPIRHGAAAPAPQRAAGVPPRSVTGYCLDYQKPPPPKGMLYRPAPDAVQQRFQPMRKILEAGRHLAESGAFKPDSTPADYATFIRQWALWTKLNNWDLNAFTREFIARTRKNVENLGRQWNAEMESAMAAAAPNRYWDILAVLAEAEGLRAAARP